MAFRSAGEVDKEGHRGVLLGSSYPNQDTTLRSQAAKSTLAVQVDAAGIGRYPQETEAALYFCTLEALQNVQKYAAASAVTVRLREEEHKLHVEVTDDGRGFDVAAVTRGAGLTNMEDRLDALGGTLQIESTPGVGTTLRATVPVSHVPPAATVPGEPLVTPEAPGRV